MRYDHGAGVAHVLAGDPWRSRVGSSAASRGARSTAAPPAPTARSPEQAVYEEGVRRVKEHIVAGDAFQIVLSQRAIRPTSATPLDVYRALRRVNPSPYLFLLELGDLALVGSSPETARQGRGREGVPEPDRRHDGAGGR